MRVGLVQLCSCDHPAENLITLERMIREAHAGGAAFILTPEVSNIITSDRDHQSTVLSIEADDPTLKRLRVVAEELSIWLLIGSLALKSGAADGRFVNRCFLISPTGTIVAWYDKIHMFDVQLGNGEQYRESAQFQPGDRAVVADTDFGKIGMTICYDLRFPHLHRTLAKLGASIITAPTAFTVPTGQAHWEVLLRARAIETGSFILAPAQCGTHQGDTTKNRKTYGHSIIIDPWGRVLAQAENTPCVTFADLDLSLPQEVRAKIPALTHDREFKQPDDHQQ
ncbi:MAG: carbon-nitrogen hydrolase family protein [Rhodobacteraceae bacterium]|nr:carbon-nitrogen hydrolase family protein [Paracoccaceae bacterium]